MMSFALDFTNLGDVYKVLDKPTYTTPCCKIGGVEG